MNINSPEHTIPDDLMPVARGLDAIAAADASTPAGFEDRLVAAVLATQPQPAFTVSHAPRPGGMHQPAMRMRLVSPLRLAAAVAAVSTLGVFYLAAHHSRQATALATADPSEAISDLEHWLALAPADDPVDLELDLLKADAEQVRQGIRGTSSTEGGAL
jgi:hypothetical protein